MHSIEFGAQIQFFACLFRMSVAEVGVLEEVCSLSNYALLAMLTPGFTNARHAISLIRRTTLVVPPVT